MIGVLSAAVLGVAAWLVVPAVTTSGAVRDARTVFCLQPAQRAALADAAMALRVAGDGSSADGVLVDGARVDLVRWRVEREDDFTRACDALSAVHNVPAATATGAATVVLPILLAVLTSALTFVSTYRRDRVMRSQTDGDALRASAKTYAEAAGAYLDGFASFPSTASPAAMETARGDLTGRLRAVQHRYPAWRAVGDVVGWLEQDELHSAGQELGRTQDAVARNARIDKLKGHVATVVEVANRAANSLTDSASQDPELERQLSGMSGQ